MIMQANIADVASGGNFFLGLCEETPGETDTLATITTEPTSAGGYARQSFARNSTGVPTVEKVNDAFRAVSLQVTFTASGADFSRSIQRAFLCNIGSGTSGLLFTYSGLLPNPLTILLLPVTIAFLPTYKKTANIGLPHFVPFSQATPF